MSSQRVLKHYQKSFIFRWWIFYYFLVRRWCHFMIFLEIPQNQWKTKENYQKPMFFLCFHWVWPKIIKWHHLRIGKKYYPSSKKKTFLSNKWNTLKTSFLKCLRVCNFFFRNDVDVRNIEKMIFFGFCVRIDCSTSDLNSVVPLVDGFFRKRPRKWKPDNKSLKIWAHNFEKPKS